MLIETGVLIVLFFIVAINLTLTCCVFCYVFKFMRNVDYTLKSQAEINLVTRNQLRSLDDRTEHLVQ